jgi:uncharacterized protein involved in response to NO
MTETLNENPTYPGRAFWSYGFRPFFLSAGLFASVAIPLWIFLITGTDPVAFHYAPRDWHVHEMLFGFLASVITGFVLTAIPNWTDRPPLSGWPLMGLWGLWCAGRLASTGPWFTPLASALIDGAFLVIVACVVWREIFAAKVWDRLPIGVLISLYASANLLFHGLILQHAATDLAERMGLVLIMMLLALIGGKITPGFTEDFLDEQGLKQRPAPFSRFDGFSVVAVGLAGIAWMMNVGPLVTGSAFVAAGVIHLIRVSRWYGWLTWRAPLVLILHVGYAWLALSFLLLGGAKLGVGVHGEEAIHALTTGAVGVMTLAVMTRASLGHTGRIKHAGPLTVLIYLLINLGALLRVFAPSLTASGDAMLVMAAGCWSGAYLLFVVRYGPMLFGRDLEEATGQ